MAYPKGKPKSEESKAKVREAMLRHHAENPEARLKNASFTGRKHSDETKAKMSEARKRYWTPEKRQAFSEQLRRDEEVAGSTSNYNALHLWMAYNFKKNGRCDLCGESRKTVFAMRNPPLAERNIDDWLELCPSCHKYYDTRRIVWAKPT